MTNRQRAAALLAARIEQAIADPVGADEVRNALGETTDFQPTTVAQVAEAASSLVRPILARLDAVNDADRYPQPELATELLPE